MIADCTRESCRRVDGTRYAPNASNVSVAYSKSARNFCAWKILPGISTVDRTAKYLRPFRANRIKDFDFSDGFLRKKFLDFSIFYTAVKKRMLKHRVERVSETMDSGKPKIENARINFSVRVYRETQKCTHSSQRVLQRDDKQKSLKQRIHGAHG